MVMSLLVTIQRMERPSLKIHGSGGLMFSCLSLKNPAKFPFLLYCFLNCFSMKFKCLMFKLFGSQMHVIVNNRQYRAIAVPITFYFISRIFYSFSLISVTYKRHHVSLLSKTT